MESEVAAHAPQTLAGTLAGGYAGARKYLLRLLGGLNALEFRESQRSLPGRAPHDVADGLLIGQEPSFRLLYWNNGNAGNSGLRKSAVYFGEARARVFSVCIAM
ncbi:hypothetical protein HDG69_002312 [Isoptericola halotolerans]|uniref:Uncharacterized protein n=1 Tax=Isoptericola halotolerans TaxID=300560 RepID=A0ABX2A4G0_9MICO|nr:hypothetical protein [Isoptericola halotolerans]NOV97737.1 hypothetical protein [Isoptericola halotolerans]